MVGLPGTRDRKPFLRALGRRVYFLRHRDSAVTFSCKAVCDTRASARCARRSYRGHDLLVVRTRTFLACRGLSHSTGFDSREKKIRPRAEILEERVLWFLKEIRNVLSIFYSIAVSSGGSDRGLHDSVVHQSGRATLNAGVYSRIGESNHQHGFQVCAVAGWC